MTPELLFHIERKKGVTAGPYDLVQMAGLLRRKIITGETMTRLEGEEDWKPFAWRPQFTLAREMPPDAVSSRTDRLDAQAREAAHPPILLPARDTGIKLAGLILGALLAFVGAFLIAKSDETTGVCLEYAGVGAVVAGQCMILARLLKEDIWTLLLLILVPAGDIVYLTLNLADYLPAFCVKYAGAAVALGAVWGLALHPK
jgi:hypothetical protein